MVFVWSQLSGGDPAYTLVQVTVNDLIMLFAFAPIVKLLVSGASGLELPFTVLLYSVLIFVVIPLALGSVSRLLIVRRKGLAWFNERFLPGFQPVTVMALLATLVAIFAFQADSITSRGLHFGPGSGAALATVVGVLVEVLVMLSVCRICVGSRPWFESPAAIL